MVENKFDKEMLILDMSVFKEMKGLEEILLSNFRIEDISPLSENEALQVITLVHTNVMDIKPLTKLEQLQVLNVFENDSVQVEEQAQRYFTDVKTNIFDRIPYSY